MKYAITLAVLVFALSYPAVGQTQRIYNLSVNLGSGQGQVNYTVTQNFLTCIVQAKHTYSYNRFDYGSFAYVNPSTGQSAPITQIAPFYEIDGSPGTSPCPKNGVSGRAMTLLEQNFQIYAYPKTGVCGTGCVSAAYVPGTFGYINPKYVVAGVFYAPPGSKSAANYTNSTTVSSTISVLTSFTNSTSVTSSTQTLAGSPLPTGVSAWLNGSITSTSTNMLTQQSQNTLSVTATVNTSDGLSIPGPSSDYVGLNHNYDYIKVWLNPVLLFTVYNTSLAGETNIGWWGYGSSALDPVAPIDTWSIQVGCLNGAFPATSSQCSPALDPQTGVFQRTWAANENWPAGQGPALTQTDLNNILAADPWGSCTPSLPAGSAACPTYTVSSGYFSLPNFSLSDQSEVSYTQPLPGSNPSPSTYGVSTTNSQTNSSQETSTYSQTYGYEIDQAGTGFLALFSSKLSFTQTLTWVYQYNSSLMTANTMTGTATIVPPACVGNPCSPSYPPSPLTFGSAVAFDIFVDSRFGTFAFLPAVY